MLDGVDLPYKKKNVNYPFSKARVYFNGVAGLLALLISIFLLLNYAGILFLFCYLLLSAAVSFIFFKIKLSLLFRMEKIDLDVVEHSEERNGDQKWKFVLVAIVLGFLLILPVVSTLFLSPVWWFTCFSGFVTGMSISEVPLYLCVEHSYESGK